MLYSIQLPIDSLTTIKLNRGTSTGSVTVLKYTKPSSEKSFALVERFVISIPELIVTLSTVRTLLENLVDHDIKMRPNFHYIPERTCLANTLRCDDLFNHYVYDIGCFSDHRLLRFSVYYPNLERPLKHVNIRLKVFEKTDLEYIEKSSLLLTIYDIRALIQNKTKILKGMLNF